MQALQQSQQIQLQQEQQPPKSQPQRKKRLKDSCDNCAASKVKCNKVKPTCTRCQDRGISCQYAPSQRSGRKATPSSASSTASATATAPASTTVTPPSEPIHFDNFNLTPANTPLSLMSDQSLGSLPSLASDSSLGSLSSLSSIGIDNTHFSDFPMNDFSNDPMWGVGPFSNLNLDAGFDSSIMSPPCYANAAANNDFGALFQTEPVPRPRANTTPISKPSPPPPLAPSYDSMDTFLSDIKTEEVKPPTDPNRPHSCLTLALNILPILHIPPQSCTLVSVSPTSCDTPTIDNIIATNKKIIESLSIMLDCPCSLDEQLASILALITFKIMTWYASAAKGTESKPSGKTSGASSPASVGKYNLDGTDNARMRAQLILSELHRVVRFLERLSKRFEEAVAHKSGGDVSMGGCSMDGMHGSGFMSASVFTQLKNDLKERLQVVAKETMGILKGGG
ncbi:MAG: hypothetical protein Q9214_006412 [Letrouitia sp. 1 TL-2023]